MKIHGGVTGGIAGTEGLAAKLGKARARTSADGPLATGDVKVSREALALAAETPARFDAVRVGALRDARETGSLQVDSKKIAERLTEEN